MNILSLDVETMANKGYFWSPLARYIGAGMLLSPTDVISFAAKWAGSRAVMYRCIHDGQKEMLALLHELMSNADMIVTYNGDSFDLKEINREFAKHGFPPVRPSKSLDLYKIVKKTFRLPYNSLDYVCSYFLDEAKLDTGGFDLWKEFVARDPRAVRLMKRYNSRDVQLTEKLYFFLRPWIRQHPYVGEVPELPDLSSDYSCPACGSKKVVLQRPRRTRCYAIRVVLCSGCGHFFDGKRKKCD